MRRRRTTRGSCAWRTCFPRTGSSREALEQISIDPSDPALFLLSGGTTGIPKLIPRTHNDYLYNSKIAAAACEIGVGDVLLDVLPIEHNLPLGCPGLQGFLLSGGTVVLGTSTRPRDVFELIQRHRVTHIHLVPALLIRWIDDPAINNTTCPRCGSSRAAGSACSPRSGCAPNAPCPAASSRRTSAWPRG